MNVAFKLRMNNDKSMIAVFVSGCFDFIIALLGRNEDLICNKYIVKTARLI